MLEYVFHLSVAPSLFNRLIPSVSLFAQFRTRSKVYCASGLHSSPFLGSHFAVTCCQFSHHPVQPQSSCHTSAKLCNTSLLPISFPSVPSLFDFHLKNTVLFNAKFSKKFMSLQRCHGNSLCPISSHFGNACVGTS